MANLDLWRGPWRDLNYFSKAVDRLMHDWPETSLRAASDLPTKYTWNPSCEITEDDNYYMLTFDIPGVSKDNIKIDLHDGRLMVSGERKEEKKTEDEDKKTLYTEKFYGSFSRSFSFPTPVNAEEAEARFSEGVLSIQVPKTSTPGARSITIK